MKTRTTLLRRGHRFAPIRGLAAKGRLSPPLPGKSRMTTARPQALQDPRPRRTQGPRPTRGAPGSPSIKHRRSRRPAVAPHPERPHLAQPAPRSRLRVSGDGGEGARARAQLLCLRPVLAGLRESSQLTGPGAARSRHLPPLKSRRGYRRRRP